MKQSNEPLRGAFTLGVASAIDYVLQFIAPLVLVRYLSVQDFGHYRAFWLVANSAYAIATIGMPFSLFYFLARRREDSIHLVSNVALFLLLSGSTVALLFIWLNPLLPKPVSSIPIPSWVTGIFIVLWVVASLLDILPNAENRIRSQAKWILFMSITRFSAVCIVAMITKSFIIVGLSLLTYALVKSASLITDILLRYKKFPVYPLKKIYFEQLKYAIPFGTAGLLYNLREQGDQWIAAIKFSMENFACFSLAGVAAPIVGIIRQSVSNAVLPKMNQNHYEGSLERALDLNRSSNWLTAVVLVPILSCGFVFAEDLIVLVYTDNYRNAYLPLKVYLVGLTSQLFVANNMMISMAKGNIMLIINLICLPISILLSWIGATWVGISGAAVGSATVLWAGNLAGLFYTKNTLRIKLSDLVESKKIILYMAGVSATAYGMNAWLTNYQKVDLLLKVFMGSIPAFVIGLIFSIKILRKL
ncbi:MAG: oligosaccharide flippase family protein [Desulfobacterales bacterium]